MGLRLVETICDGEGDWQRLRLGLREDWIIFLFFSDSGEFFMSGDKEYFLLFLNTVKGANGIVRVVGVETETVGKFGKCRQCCFSRRQLAKLSVTKNLVTGNTKLSASC